MFEQSLTFNDAVLTVRRENVKSRLLRGMVYRHFNINEDIDEAEFLLIQAFVQFLTQVQVHGDIGFPIPKLSASRENIMEAYEAFLNLPGEFFDVYHPALKEVDEVVGDPELTPDENGKKKQPKTRRAHRERG